MPFPLTIVIEGWHHIPHSYAMCTQQIELELLGRPDVRLFHTHQPYASDAWKPDLKLFSQAETEKLQAIPPRPPDLRPDVVLRMDWPFRLERDPSGCETFVWGTTEFLCVPPLFIASGRPPREELPDIKTHIIALSHWAAAGFLESGSPAERVHVVPAGFNPAIFYPPTNMFNRQQLRESFGWNDECVLLNISALSPNKGIQYLLYAAAHAIDRGVNMRVVIKGTDSLYSSNKMLQRCLEKLPRDVAEKLTDRIQYCGDNITTDQLRAFYQAADFYVSAYMAEGFNMPVLEAAACGLPVICTAGGSTEDFIDSSWCRTIQSRIFEEPDGCALEPNIDSLITVLTNSISDREWIQSARLAGPAWVKERYTWTHVVDQLLKLFRRFA